MTPLPSPTLAATSSAAFDILGGIFAGGLAFLFWGLIVWLIVLVDILKSKFKESTNKIIWLVLTFVLPFLGPVLYLFIGKKQTKNNSGIDLKAAFTVISFFIFSPLGVVLMWFWTTWPKWVKILLTVFSLLFVGFGFWAQRMSRV